ncbi:exodeoxyribonuclease V subunit alpha [Aquabacterium humicola]|uniref:exodeoxyribonuclease V subunit alpha n=1 Tax=Aquabacterium humicola TaxID=3237377 RepID=UPI0025430025|nr:exodeoxyribonuclease V subunit alpha [Rubrivivax pictus]
MSEHALLLQRLRAWREAGHLRALDLAFARLLHTLDPAAPASLLLAGALAAHFEGRRHSCVKLDELLDELPVLSGWPPEMTDEVRGLLPPTAEAATAWSASPLIEIAPSHTAGSTPLVWCDGRLYLRRYWHCESAVAAQVRARTAPAPADDVDAAAARLWLDRLFPPPAAPRGRAAKAAAADAPFDWQKLACVLALRGRLLLVTGGPGTGKTFTAARLLVLLQALHRGPQPLRVALAAPTGKAAARLRQSIDAALQTLRTAIDREVFGHDPLAAPGPARTLHALLGVRPDARRPQHDAARPLDVDLLFVDEASMVNLEMMALLLDALPPRARLVLLGDKDQLESVETGAVLGDLCEGADAGGYDDASVQWLSAVGGLTLPPEFRGAGAPLAQQTAMLRTSRRFGGAIGALAQAVNRGDAAAARRLLADDAGRVVATLAEAPDLRRVQHLALAGRDRHDGYGRCFRLLADRPDDPAAFDDWARNLLRTFVSFRVLCAVREGPQGVQAVNAAIEQALVEAGLLKTRRGEWYEGRPVMVTRNDAALGIFNGDIGLVLRPPGSGAGEGAALRVYLLDGEVLRSVSAGRLPDVETAFALTVHKSQGSEFAHVLLVLPADDSPVLTRELLYTAITRAREAFTLAAPQPALVDAAVQRLTRRHSGLRALLDRASS